MIRSWNKLNKNESGQAALEAAIILIAFVVVASVFAFAVLSAGQASTTKGEQAIYAGLNNVQSSMVIKGSVTAEEGGTTTKYVNDVIFDVALVSGGDPVNLADGLGQDGSTVTTPVVVIAYRDATQAVPNLVYSVSWIVNNQGAHPTDADDLLETGELAEIKVTLTPDSAGDPLTQLTKALGVNTPFTLEVKPPTGAVLQINRTTPAALAAEMNLQ